MCSKGFLKRMLPFLATFAVGVFIASFFVSFSGPGFRGRGKRHHEMQRLRIENEELRNENLRLKNEMENLRWDSPHMKHPGDRELFVPGLDETQVQLPPPPPMPLERRAKR